MTPKDRDNYVLSSGREFYANCGIIGISPDGVGNGDQLSHGYDGGIDVKGDSWDKKPSPDDWTVLERCELADYMIGLWQKWKDAQQ